jgi:thiol-disulfide isomerase/thioredoxin
MRHWICGIAVSLLVLATIARPLPGQDTALALEGKKAPTFKIDFALNGKARPKPSTTPNPEPEGHPVVLLSFWAVWCPPCRTSFPHLVRLHENYGRKGLTVVGVTKNYKNHDFKDGKLIRAEKPLDAKAEQKMLTAFVKHHKLPYRIEMSADATTNFKINAIPTFVLIDRKGKVRMVKIGASEAGMKEMEAKIKALLAEK